MLKYPASYEETTNPGIVPAIAEGPQSIRLIDRKSSKPPKCYLNSECDVVEWVLTPLTSDEQKVFTSVNTVLEKHAKPKFKSFDCSIMDVADDIAYGVHDLEDAIAMGLITERDFRSLVTEEKCESFIQMLKRRKPDGNHNNFYDSIIAALFGNSKERKHYIGRLVHHFITSVDIVENDQFNEPLIRYNAVLIGKEREFLDALQALIVKKVISSAEVQHLEFKGQKMVVSVFEALASEPEAMLPKDVFAAYRASGDDLRVICDYVAGMTDGFLLKTYDRLFSPRMGSVFDKI